MLLQGCGARCCAIYSKLARMLLLSGFLLKAINRTSTNEGILSHERGKVKCNLQLLCVVSTTPLLLQACQGLACAPLPCAR